MIWDKLFILQTCYLPSFTLWGNKHFCRVINRSFLWTLWSWHVKSVRATTEPTITLLISTGVSRKTEYSSVSFKTEFSNTDTCFMINALGWWRFYFSWNAFYDCRIFRFLYLKKLFSHALFFSSQIFSCFKSNWHKNGA